MAMLEEANERVINCLVLSSHDLNVSWTALFLSSISALWLGGVGGVSALTLKAVRRLPMMAGTNQAMFM